MASSNDPHLRQLVLLLCFLAAGGWRMSGRLAAASEPGPINLAQVQELAVRLHQNLPPAARAKVNPAVVVGDPSVWPVLRPSEMEGGHVFVSAKAIDLIDRIARAKAIDSVKKGYLAGYIGRVAGTDPTTPWPALPDNQNPRYASLDVENEHVSNFNQIMGGLLAVAVAQIHLGLVGIHPTGLSVDGRPVPINHLLSDKEWKSAFESGIKLAVACAYTTEGLGEFFLALDRMKPSPPWVEMFIPTRSSGSSLAKIVAAIQRQMFR